MSSIPPNIRSELTTNSAHGRRRSSVFSRDRPTDWRPGTVVDPRDQERRCFTDLTAWSFIEEILLAECDVVAILLDKPPGKTGYVLKVKDHPNIYIKLQLATPGVVGRSFHYSNFTY